jgi:hypothetical protein
LYTVVFTRARAYPFTVRVNLEPPTLRRRFWQAWDLVPSDVQVALRPRLRVRWCSDKYPPVYRAKGYWERVLPLDFSGAFVHPFGPDDPLRIFLDRQLARQRSPRAVYVILHELAHAWDHVMIHDPFEADSRRLDAHDELAAERLVSAWAGASQSALAQSITAHSREWHGEQARWCRSVPTWWSDDERQEDALLRERYEEEL